MQNNFSTQKLSEIVNVFYTNLLNFNFLELNEKGAWGNLQIVKRFHEFTNVDDNCERIDINEVTPEKFIEKYEKVYQPVVICGIQTNWKAKYRWNLEAR